jgi:hypothetical protein
VAREATRPARRPCLDCIGALLASIAARQVIVGFASSCGAAKIASGSSADHGNRHGDARLIQASARALAQATRSDSKVLDHEPLSWRGRYRR